MRTILVMTAALAMAWAGVTATDMRSLPLLLASQATVLGGVWLATGRERV